jgi:DNA gyrase subunit A
MTFREGDTLLSASVADDTGYVFVVTEGGYAKRTGADQYRVQNRGGLGIKVAKLAEARGDLAGALIVGDDDEVLVVLSSGKVVRSAVAEVPAKGRDTMGVVFARFAADDRIIALARNTERNLVAPSDEAVIDAVGDNDAVPAVSPGDVIDAVEPVTEAPADTADDSSTGEEPTNE